MRLALLADVHANSEALSACLAHARERGADRYAFLGDLIGYGLAIVGSAGQPRDGDTAAGYALFDPARATLTFLRVPYDWSTAAAKVRAAGLPEWLAHRLERGQ